MAIDIFAKIGDIKGESFDDKHKDEIEVLSFSWRVSHSPANGPGSGEQTGKASFQDLSITHHVDKATPQLMLACATGQHLKEATITYRKAGKSQQEFLIIKMSDVIITGIAPSGSTDASLTEQVAINFAKVDLEYRPTKQDGSLDAGIHFKFDQMVGK